MKLIDITPSDHMEMVNMFKDETDRGAAVLTGSYVDNFLGLYLKSCMEDHSVSDRLFGANGPLSTFSNRIDFAWGFGYLSPDMCSDLHLIRRIRNHFAHHPKGASFSQSPVREWTMSLTTSRKVDLGNERFIQIEDPRTAFLIAAGILMIIAGNKVFGPGDHAKSVINAVTSDGISVDTVDLQRQGESSAK